MTAPAGPRRFGDFMFDAASGELSRCDHGTSGPINRLQPQVAALLDVLLERPGEVLTRAELQARLWPDTTVDFDEGLNYAVRQLRLALGDDANAPRYIETLPRRGYRFIAPLVTELPTPVAVTTHRRVAMLAGALVMIALIAVIAVLLARRVGARSARHAIDLAVVPFQVDTSDSLMTTYHRRFMDQLRASAGRESGWRLVSDPSQATYVLSGTLTRQKFSVAIFVQLVQRAERRHLWADSILDTYPFAGNSTLMADRIERSVIKVLVP